MTRKLLIAGAASALLLGGAALAQTAQQNDPAAPAGATTAPGQTDRSMTSDAAAPAAGTYGADTAAAADDQSMQMAGERG